MQRAYKQPGLHQTIKVMFMLKAPEIKKAPRERFSNLPKKNVP